MSADRWHFAITFDAVGRGESDPSAWFADGHLHIACDNVIPAPRLERQGGRVIVLFGNPIFNGKRHDAVVLRAIAAERRVEDWAARIDGSFLVLLYEPDTPALTIVNDRFASLALYGLSIKGRWYAASTPKLLWDRHGEARHLNATGAAEFLFLRRLLGEKTLSHRIACLASASICAIGADGEPHVRRYWRPDYGRRPLKDSEVVRRLVEGLRQAVAAHQSDADGRNYGLLLSGGLDSRALLAAARPPLTCFTTCLRENNESRVARAVAAAANMPFHFIPRPPDLYEGRLDDAAFLTGGQQLYAEAQFLGYRPRLPIPVDSLFIGLGLDIFFAGLYLRKEQVRWLGRPVLHYRLASLGPNIAETYLDHVGYRLKQSDPGLVLRRELAGDVRDRLLASIGDILARGRKLGADGHDLWEYMHIHNLSRHYSFPMIASVRSFTDCRAPALDNALFDLALRMTPHQKVNGILYQRAVTRLAPGLMALDNANTNMPAHLSLGLQTVRKAALYSLNYLLGTPYPIAPGRADRSWPGARESLERAPTIMERMGRLAQSEWLASVPFLSMEGVASVVDDHLSHRHDHAVLINVLLTLESFLSSDKTARQ